MMVTCIRSYATPLSRQDDVRLAHHAAERRSRDQGDRRLPHRSRRRCRSFPVLTTERVGAFRGAAVQASCPREMKRFVTWFNDTAPGARKPAAGAHARRDRASLFRLHSPVRGRQRPHRPRARGEIAGAEPRAAKLDRARLHHRAQAQGLLRCARTQQQGQRDHRLADVLRRHGPRSAAQHARSASISTSRRRDSTNVCAAS